MLGSYSQPNNGPLFGWVLVAKDVTNDSLSGVLRQPIDYTLVWSSDSMSLKKDGNGYICLPTPPDGYKAIGHIITRSPEKPSLDRMRCVWLDFTDDVENDEWIWGAVGRNQHNSNRFNVYSSRPKHRGVQELGVPTGSCLAQNDNKSSSSLACLKSAKLNLSAMPNLEQINALIQTYSPIVYFHPDEQYFPSSVSWFFENWALIYQKGYDSKPMAIQISGSNLPQGGSNEDEAKESLKKQNLQSARAYFHVKPMFGATFTDLAVWIFYPFNGPAMVNIGSLVVPLGKIGQHVGDWEHLTLRVSNFDGQLRRVYFSQHSKGKWISSSEIEFQKSRNNNKPVAYSSLNGYASYPKPGLVL